VTITVRRASPLDTREMAEILAALIENGAATAVSGPVSRADIAEWIAFDPDRSAWHVAENAAGHILGFQFIEPNPALPDACCDIASYVRPGQGGVGIGSALFDATRRAARALGYTAIVAVIRADNAAGLAYYQSRGFEDWQTWHDAPIAPQIVKRHDL